MKIKNPNNSMLPWKVYVITTIESLLAFYMATFCFLLFFFHRGTNWMLSGTAMIIFYIFIMIICATRIIKTFSLPALMLITPMAPLFALIIIVTLLPILEKLQLS